MFYPLVDSEPQIHASALTPSALSLQDAWTRRNVVFKGVVIESTGLVPTNQYLLGLRHQEADGRMNSGVSPSYESLQTLPAVMVDITPGTSKAAAIAALNAIVTALTAYSGPVIS